MRQLAMAVGVAGLAAGESKSHRRRRSGRCTSWHNVRRSLTHAARLLPLLLFHPVYTSSSQCKRTAKTQPHRIGLHAADYSSVMMRAVAIDKENNVDTTTSNGGGVTAS